MVEIAHGVRSTINADGAALLDIEHNQIVTLNATGAYIWGKMQHGQTVEDIIGNLSHETGADPLLVAEDVHGFVEQLVQKRLLRS
jgi:Coenzyme PQQ synthesis protein D (PqqD)